jgi:hypothetical protein
MPSSDPPSQRSLDSAWDDALGDDPLPDSDDARTRIRSSAIPVPMGPQAAPNPGPAQSQEHAALDQALAKLLERATLPDNGEVDDDRTQVMYTSPEFEEDPTHGDDDDDGGRTRMVHTSPPPEAFGSDETPARTPTARPEEEAGRRRSDQRDTLPPPVPEMEYVQTMMQQADPEVEPPSPPPPSPSAWRAPSVSPSGPSSSVPRSWPRPPTSAPPVSSGRTGLGVRGPLAMGGSRSEDRAPPSELRRAVVAEPRSPDSSGLRAPGGRKAPITSPSPPFSPSSPAPNPTSHKAQGGGAGGFRGRPVPVVPAMAGPVPLRAPSPFPADPVLDLALVPMEPEPWSDRSAFVDPRHGGEPDSGGFDALDNLPFDDLVAASQRSGVSEPPGALPLPRPLKLAAPAESGPIPPSSRNEPKMASIPPILDMGWSPPEPEPEPPPRAPEADFGSVAPPTKRGLFDSPVPPPPKPGTRPFEPFQQSPRAPAVRAARPASEDAPRSPRARRPLSDVPRPPSTQRTPAAEPPPRAPPAVDPFDEVRELYDAGDFRSALVMAEAFLAQSPDHPEAQSCAQSCRDTLGEKYLSRLGGRARVLRVAMAPDEIRWLSLDHKAGFLLSCIDGTTSIEDVIDLASMSEFETIRILHDFRELGVVEVVPERPRRG